MGKREREREREVEGLDEGTFQLSFDISNFVCALFERLHILVPDGWVDTARCMLRARCAAPGR